MSSQNTPGTGWSGDAITAAEARAEWMALACEAGLVGDLSFEALLDRLETLVLDR